MINTKKTVERASTVLGKKCEATQKNLDKLMADAGIGGGRKVKMAIPVIPGSRDDVIFAGLNGVKFYFLRGAQAEVPEAVLSILRSTGTL